MLLCRLSLRSFSSTASLAARDMDRYSASTVDNAVVFYFLQHYKVTSEGSFINLVRYLIKALKNFDISFGHCVCESLNCCLLYILKEMMFSNNKEINISEYMTH